MILNHTYSLLNMNLKNRGCDITMIDKELRVPIYHQLEEHIKQQIENEILKSGDLIPSEREFSEKNNISRMTVRQAITNLVKDGYLIRQRGKGTFVAGRKIEQKLHGLTSFTEDMLARGMTPSTKLLSFKVESPTKKIAEQLCINMDTKVYKIERIRLGDNTPMAFEISYIATSLVGELTEDIINHSLYKYVENQLKLPIKEATQFIEASIARKVDSQIFGIKEGTPVLLMRRYTTLENGQPFEIVKSIYRGDRYKFISKISRN